jgi:ferredoxin/flavodoxin---NADP+ reductase
MSTLNRERILSVHHWTDGLFSFRTTRTPSFRFASGQFTMIGLEVMGRPLLRAYSMASPNYDECLEFFSINVPNGPLTSKLCKLREGDTLLVSSKATGTLVHDDLQAGRVLYLMATGTGLAPFLSLIRDPDLYERFETIVLVHGVRTVAELAYQELISQDLPADEYLGENVGRKLRYYPTVTREAFATRGRVTELFSSGKLQSDLGLPVVDASVDRVMLCGGPAMLADARQSLEGLGFTEGSHSCPGQYVIEKSFVER